MEFAVRALTLVTSLTLVACGPAPNPGNGDDDGDDSPGNIDGGGINEFPADAAPAEACDKIDFLFVVDDSGSMGEEQTNLAQNFPMFITLIEQYMTTAGSPIDYRIAVTTTGRDLAYTIAPPMIPGFPIPIPPIMQNEQGDDGAFRMSSSCGMTRRWFERGDANVPQNFACVAKVGTGGPSIEMPLYATELALDDRVADGTNAGFLRQDALLAVVILTDENDCSREDNNFTVETDACDSSLPQIQPVAKYVDFLDGLKGARGRWAAAVIAGPTNCSSSFGDAIAATRLLEFVSATGQNAVFSSICEGNLTSALNDALNTFTAACENFEPIE